jgi:hypothetical protein
MKLFKLPSLPLYVRIWNKSGIKYISCKRMNVMDESIECSRCELCWRE